MNNGTWCFLYGGAHERSECLLFISALLFLIVLHERYS
nr:MAG TPA: hypothetical protein [Crassvirales sp.]